MLSDKHTAKLEYYSPYLRRLIQILAATRLKTLQLFAVYLFLTEGGGASNGIGPPDSLGPVDFFGGAEAPPSLTDIVWPSFSEKSCLGAAGVLDEELLLDWLKSSLGARWRLTRSRDQQSQSISDTILAFERHPDHGRHTSANLVTPLESQRLLHGLGSPFRGMRASHS